MPNGRDMMITAGAIGPRNGVIIPTDWEQNRGVPAQIDRPLSANNRGLVGPNVDSFPMTSGMDFVGHVPLVHVAQGIAPRQGITIDDFSQIAAVFVGNPER